MNGNYQTIINTRKTIPPIALTDIYDESFRLFEKNERVYLSFLDESDCLLCNVHIFNMAFDKDRFIHPDTIVVFVLQSTTKDLQNFIAEHPQFPFKIVIDSGEKLRDEIKKYTKYKYLLFGILKNKRMPFFDVLINNSQVSEYKAYQDDKEHFSYEKIEAFLKHGV